MWFQFLSFISGRPVVSGGLESCNGHGVQNAPRPVQFFKR
jgi:hypothetical protein